MEICLKKPEKIKLIYENTTVEIDPPDFFSQLFFTVDEKVGKELESLDVLSGLKE